MGLTMGAATRLTDVAYLVAKPAEKEGNVQLFGMTFDPRQGPHERVTGRCGTWARRCRSTVGSDKDSGPFIFSDRYQLTAIAAFYTKGRPRAYCANFGNRRQNQYDLWDGWEKLVGP